MRLYSVYCDNISQHYLVKAEDTNNAKFKLMEHLRDWLDKLEAESNKTGIDVNVSFFVRELTGDVIESADVF